MLKFWVWLMSGVLGDMARTELFSNVFVLLWAIVLFPQAIVIACGNKTMAYGKHKNVWGKFAVGYVS